MWFGRTARGGEVGNRLASGGRGTRAGRRTRTSRRLAGRPRAGGSGGRRAGRPAGHRTGEVLHWHRRAGGCPSGGCPRSGGRLAGGRLERVGRLRQRRNLGGLVVHRNTKVNQLGRLAFEILPSSLSDGYVDSRDIPH